MNETQTRTMQDGTKVPFREQPGWVDKYRERMARFGGGGYRERRRQGINQGDEDDLYYDCDPKYILQREYPWHRTVINMSVAGYTNREIARMVGRGDETVENVLRQPFARDYIKKEAKKTVQDEIKELLESQVMPSLKALERVRDTSDKGCDVIAASNSILDRAGVVKKTEIAFTKSPAEMTDEEIKAAIMKELDEPKPN